MNNLINGKIYIGKHQTTNPDDSYYGSGIAILDAIRKYGRENFSKVILFDFDAEDEMNLKEKELITEEFVARDDTYNLGIGGEGGPHFKGKKHSEEWKENRKLLWSTDAHRQKMKDSLNDDAIREKMKEGSVKGGFKSKGRKLSDETKDRMKLAQSLRDSNTNKKISDSVKSYYENTPKEERLTKKRIRKPLSEETKEKLRQVQLKRWSKQNLDSMIP